MPTPYEMALNARDALRHYRETNIAMREVQEVREAQGKSPWPERELMGAHDLEPDTFKDWLMSEREKEQR